MVWLVMTEKSYLSLYLVDLLRYTKITKPKRAVTGNSGFLVSGLLKG